MKRIMVTTWTAGAVLMGAMLAQADDKVTVTREGTEIHSQHKVSSTSGWRASKLLGATVRDRAGETLGTVQDIVLDPSSGQANFAVVSLSLPGHQGHYTAVPWRLVQTTSEPNRVVVSVDQNRITSAPMFESSAWPDFEPAYTQRVYTYYNLDYNRPAVGGRVMLEGTESGSYKRGKENNFPRPQPDGREVFPELDERNKTEQ